jgi:hypothetical protein
MEPDACLPLAPVNPAYFPGLPLSQVMGNPVGLLDKEPHRFAPIAVCRERRLPGDAGTAGSG